jgi:hypothetical protein
MALIKASCSEPPRSVNKFGMRDDAGATKAYSVVTDPDKWIAIVVNADRTDVVFTAIDYCENFYKPSTKNRESTCDGLLTKRDKLHLVELKERNSRDAALSKGISQLRNTIRLLIDRDKKEVLSYKDRKAHVCNRLHPAATIVAGSNKKFLKETGFRLGVRATVII